MAEEMTRSQMLEAMVEDEEASVEICDTCKLTAPDHIYREGFYYCPTTVTTKTNGVSDRSPNLGSKIKEVNANIERMRADDRADAYVPSTRPGGRYPRRN